MKRLSVSRVRNAMACLRAEKYQYVDGFRPLDDSGALRFGKLLHYGLEAWMLACQDAWPAPLERGLAALREQAGPDADPFEMATAESLLVGYHERWVDQPYEILAVEVPFEAPLINPASGRPSRTWIVNGIIDAIVRRVDTGDVYLMEHKTSSEDVAGGAAYWTRTRLDAQVSAYVDGARALGYQPVGCLYDVIKKPGSRPLKATPAEARKYKKDGTLYAAQRERDETPEEYRARLFEGLAEDPNAFFVRQEVVRLEEELIESRRDLWQIAENLHAAHRANAFPRNTSACHRYGRACPFLGVCLGEASLEDETKFRRRRLDVVAAEAV